MLLRAGVYNETVFKGIDYILDQMADQGIRVIIAFIDYWKQTDGVQQARSAACKSLQWCEDLSRWQSCMLPGPLHAIAQDRTFSQPLPPFLRSLPCTQQSLGMSI